MRHRPQVSAWPTLEKACACSQSGHCLTLEDTNISCVRTTACFVDVPVFNRCARCHILFCLPAGCQPDAIKLFVGNIPKVYTEDQLLPFFETIGKVGNCWQPAVMCAQSASQLNTYQFRSGLRCSTYNALSRFDTELASVIPSTAHRWWSW
jgi:hypothetical protein